MSDKPVGYLPGQRYETPDALRKWKGPYQFDSMELQDLVTQHIQPTWTRTIDLGTAQSPQQPLVLEQPGRAFRVQGLTTSTLYDPVANTGIETVATTVFAGVFINQSQGGDPADAIFLKNGNGFRGDFIRLALFWPAQSGNSLRITIYRYDGQPWMSGDFST